MNKNKARIEKKLQEKGFIKYKGMWIRGITFMYESGDILQELNNINEESLLDNYRRRQIIDLGISFVYRDNFFLGAKRFDNNSIMGIKVSTPEEVENAVTALENRCLPAWYDENYKKLFKLENDRLRFSKELGG